MGFKFEVVEYAAQKVNYSSVEAIIDYITGKDEHDGLFNHDFVNYKHDMCFVCEEDIAHHRQQVMIVNNNEERKSSHSVHSNLRNELINYQIENED